MKKYLVIPKLMIFKTRLKLLLASSNECYIQVSSRLSETLCTARTEIIMDAI